MLMRDSVPSSSTLLGSPGAISSILDLMRLIVAIGFSPNRATTTPPTASLPSFVSTPRRSAGPVEILAISRSRIGCPSCATTAVFSRSSIDSMNPMPRTTYSARFTSIVRAPTSRLDRRTAFITCVRLIPAARIASGLTSTWYSRTNPPIDATSETPSTPERRYLT